MVHAEQFRLRTNSDAEGDCHDYIGTFLLYFVVGIFTGINTKKECNFFLRNRYHPS